MTICGLPYGYNELTKDKITLIKELGFNIISIGIQDFDMRVQKAINRDCNEDSVKRIIEKCKKVGLRVHIDLCYGLPFQSLSEFENTLHITAKLDPDRIIVSPYAHYPLLYPNQKMIPTLSLPNSFLKFLLSIITDDILISYGYFKVGIDHYIKSSDSMYALYFENKVLRTLMGYSADARENYIGFGNSAISYYNNHFYHNKISLKDYYSKLDEGNLPIEDNLCYSLNDDDYLRNILITKYILTYFSINKEEIENKFSIIFNDYFSYELNELNGYIDDGIIEEADSNIISLSKTGKYFARHIAYLFDNFYRSNIKKRNPAVSN